MKKYIVAAGLLFTLPLWALNDGFNFSECSGSGSFEQQIQHYGGDYENAITVGTIPIGIEGLNIELTSDKDVDIRLYGQNNDKIVHWPYGLLSHASEGITDYQGTEVTYSGYNGFDGEKGHEYINVSGTTKVPMTMKAFGYQAGFATVNYSWTGKEGCDNSGDGNFTQSIAHDALTLVGEIPAGIPNVEVLLKSDKDLDIQLYGEDGTVIVGWKPEGLLNGPSVELIDYHGMSIEWSGYNGLDGNKGHEYIAIMGKTTEKLTMKVYGYEAGFADVTYSWHEIPPTPTPTQEPCPDVYEPVCGQYMIIGGQETFGNMCELENASNIGYVHDGECNTTIEPTPTPTPQPYLDVDVDEPVCGYPWINGTFVFVPTTYQNMCHLGDANALYISEGECNDTIEPTPTPTPTVVPTPQPCLDIYEPVCGYIDADINNPQTYSNSCELENAEATWISDGECDITPTPTPQPCITKQELQNKVISGEDITDVNTSCITDMSELFLHADEFNQPIGNWDVSNVTNMAFMFSGAKIFNQDISAWDVSNVTNMNDMFAHTNKFNQDISNWEVSQVNNMNGMFWEAKAFNQPIWKWNVSFDTYMPIMFLDATSFAQNLSNWHVIKPELLEQFAEGSLMPKLYLPDFSTPTY